ncbi:MAG: hypothetical protein ACQEWG_16400 [Bacteroidota bacterium]
MKKTFFIILIIGLLNSCGTNEAVSKIDGYINEISTRDDLTQSIIEFNTENLDGEIVGGIDIYELTDENGETHRIIAEVVQPTQSPKHYVFYFKKDNLTYARVIEFDESGNDTIVDSKYYFSGADLIKQIDEQENKIVPETVRQLSDFYRAYGKEETK